MDVTGMREVTMDEFYATVGPMNVHPRVEPEYTIWETPNRTVVGRSLPGYRNPGDPKLYFVAG